VSDYGRVLALLQKLGVEVRALRRDLDSLRHEVRAENANLRAQLALFMARQNRVIEDTKKKQRMPRSWPSPRRCLWPSPTRLIA
jgi:hypothetical protein